MKKAIITFLFLYLFCSCKCPLFSQPYKRICVIGSSTAWGYFRDPNPPNLPLYPRDSAWTFKLSKYYMNLGEIDTLFNIASVGTDPYTGMPSSYTPPASRNLPDARYNITKAVNLVPKPDAIIVNYPSNNFDWQTDQEILFCLQTIKDSANANGIQCYITTTQPRNTFSNSEKQKLKYLRDIILNRFGQYAIDFFTDIVEEPSLNILPIYSLGDGIHTNPQGQTVLEQRIIEKNILLNTLPVTFMDLKVTEQNHMVIINWLISSVTEDIDHFIIERSSDGRDFSIIGQVRATGNNVVQKYSFQDEHPSPATNYFRIVAVQKDNQKIFSKVIPVLLTGKIFSVGKIYPVPAKDEISIKIVPVNKGDFDFTILNAEGKTIKKEKMKVEGDIIYHAKIGNFSSGKYTLLIQHDLQIESIQFIK